MKEIVCLSECGDLENWNTTSWSTMSLSRNVFSTSTGVSTCTTCIERNSK